MIIENPKYTAIQVIIACAVLVGIILLLPGILDTMAGILSGQESESDQAYHLGHYDDF